MIVLESKIAKKYSVAFLNICNEKEKTESIDILEGVSRLLNFVNSNKLFQAILTIPSVTLEKKQNIIDQVSKKLALQKPIQNLILLLLKDKRIDLLDDVLQKIVFLNKQREKRSHFNVTTSHELDNDKKKIIKNFIQSLLKNKNITITFAIDLSLISGTKITGNGFLWERSIAKQLRKIEQKILRREELW